MPRPMHCPVCTKQIPLLRRLQKRWYCSEAHFLADTERRVQAFDRYGETLNTMICSRRECRSDISWWRRLLGYEFCSADCHRQRYGSRVALDSFELQIGTKESWFRVTGRRSFLFLITSGVCTGLFTVLRDSGNPFAAIGQISKPAFNHQVHFSDWSAPSAASWIGVGGVGEGWLAPVGVMLYSAVQQARQGILQYRLSVAPTGMARFLIGASENGKQGYQVQVQSLPMQFVLSAWRIADGGRTRMPKTLVIDRLTRTVIDLKIEFEANSIQAALNQNVVEWSGLNLAPGRIGVEGGKSDDLRVYEANVSLLT